jgi:hypothetical protein
MPFSKAWYRWQAKEGANWFTITLLGGLGLLEQEARFTRQFSARLLAGGTLWEITSELEIRERPVLDEGLLNLLLSEDPAGLIFSGNSLHILVHQTLPITSELTNERKKHDLADRSAGSGCARPDRQPNPA